MSFNNDSNRCCTARYIIYGKDLSQQNTTFSLTIFVSLAPLTVLLKHVCGFVPQSTYSSSHLFLLPLFPQPNCSSAHLFLNQPVHPPTCSSSHLFLNQPVPPPTCSSTNLFIRPPVPPPTCSSTNLFIRPPVPPPTCSSTNLFIRPPVPPPSCSSALLLLLSPFPSPTPSPSHPFLLPPVPVVRRRRQPAQFFLVDQVRHSHNHDPHAGRTQPLRFRFRSPRFRTRPSIRDDDDHVVGMRSVAVA